MNDRRSGPGACTPRVCVLVGDARTTPGLFLASQQVQLPLQRAKCTCRRSRKWNRRRRLRVSGPRRGRGRRRRLTHRGIRAGSTRRCNATTHSSDPLPGKKKVNGARRKDSAERGAVRCRTCHGGDAGEETTLRGWNLEPCWRLAMSVQKRKRREE